MKPLAFTFQSLLRCAHLTRPSHNLGVNTPKKYLSLSSIAERYGLKPRTFKIHADEKGVPFLSFGTSRRYDPDVTDTFFAAAPPEKKEITQKVLRFERPKRKKAGKSKFAEALR